MFSVRFNFCSDLSCHFLACETIVTETCPVPEIIDPVFAKTSQNARFLLSENERFGLVFVKTGSINSGTGSVLFGIRIKGPKPSKPRKMKIFGGSCLIMYCYYYYTCMCLANYSAIEAVNLCSSLVGTWGNPPNIRNKKAPVILENKISCSLFVVFASYF